MNDNIFDILLRRVARIPSDWKESKETWKQAGKRRRRLATKLRNLATELRGDPDANVISFSPGLAAFTGIPLNSGVMLTFADLMEIEARSIEGRDGPDVVLGRGKIMTAREFDERSRPKKIIPLQSYALHAIFEQLKPYYPNKAPNREAEMLAGTLLQKAIKPGTVTHMRKATRRRYAREK